MFLAPLKNFVSISLVSLVLGACSTVVRVPSDPATSVTPGAPTEAGSRHVQPEPRQILEQLRESEQAYARVLARYVDEKGRVGFAALAMDTSDSGLPALERYVRAIGRVRLEDLPPGPVRLAHMINAYNALSMYNVVRSGLPPSHAGFAKLRFFVLRKFQIGEQLMSLYSFENDVIRKLNEPRIHFALNCSAVSCPVLPQVPFAAGNLNETLDQETRKFFANPANLNINHEKRTVYFNEILKFYTEDFTPAHAPSLITYAQRYIAQAIPSDYETAFAPYDWTVAHRP
jgi:Protein of unknown function, DUF547